jgi:hypothetical protein
MISTEVSEKPMQIAFDLMNARNRLLQLEDIRRGREYTIDMVPTDALVESATVALLSLIRWNPVDHHHHRL